MSYYVGSTACCRTYKQDSRLMFNNGNACVLFLLGASYTGTLALIFLLRTSGNVSLFGLKKIRSKIRRIGNNRVKISSRIKNLETMGQKISGVNELDGCSSAIWYPLKSLFFLSLKGIYL